ncbi:MAG: hypothetical protein NZ531_05700 [Aquificaceae bacterium]|nr:hypothetical protein [Aquificaceae bacterium]
MMAAERARENEQVQRSKVFEFLSQQRFSLLLTVFLALLAIFLWLLRSTPEGQRLLISWQAKREASISLQRFQESLSKDPKLGLPLGKVGINSVPNSSKPVLLVVLGECEGCNEKVVHEWVEVLSKWETLRKEVLGILVIQEGIEKVREIEKGAKGVRLVADREGKVAKSLNAFFVPRAYGFVDGKLVWMQKEANMGIVGSLEGFLEVVKGEERAREILNAWSAEIREKAWGKEITSFVKGGEKR